MKTVFVLVVAIASVTAEGLYCTPNTNFNIACNSCVCSNDGKSAACTDMACPELNQRAEPKQVCTPRTQFKDYCNTCFCAVDGQSYGCTKMACDPAIWNKDGSLKIETRVQAPRKVCKPKSQFKEYCNTCACAEDGQSYACTRMACDPAIWNEDGSMKLELPQKPRVAEVEEPRQICKPRTQYKQYCNNCFCSDDGRTAACTGMYCDKRIWNEDGSMKIPARDVVAPVARPSSIYERKCEPGKPFKYYCNTCSCRPDGTVGGCTRMLCNPEFWNEDGTRKDANKEQTCEPGKAFSPDGCNTCICNEDGTQSVCTLKACLSNLIETQADKEAKKWGPLYRQGASCNPGETFYSQCNQCVCTRDGRSAFCTLKACT